MRIFIVNPVSGGKKSIEVSLVIRKICEEDNLDYKIIYTSEKGDATNIVKDFANDIIYSVGGDGTINEIVNGIIGSSNSLSIIPSGTGNDFYRSVSNNRSIDVGKVNDRYFLNIASIGLDAEVANKANIIKEKGGKSLIYPRSIITTVPRFKNLDINIDYFKKNITLLAIANGRYYGGGIPICPNAEIDDGFFDICIAEDIKKIKIPKLLLDLLKGQHNLNKEVSTIRRKKISVKSDELFFCNLDGEIITGDNFDFSIMENALNIYNEDNLKLKRLVRQLF